MHWINTIKEVAAALREIADAIRELADATRAGEPDAPETEPEEL